VKEKVGPSFTGAMSGHLQFNSYFRQLPNHAGVKLTKLPDFEAMVGGLGWKLFKIANVDFVCGTAVRFKAAQLTIS